MPDVSGKLKRLLGDLSGMNTFSVPDINNWIKDACDTLGNKYYQKFLTDDGVVITPVPTNAEEELIALQAAIIAEEGEYAKASKGGIIYRDAAHSFDTTRKGNDYQRRIESLETKLNKLIFNCNQKKVDPKFREFSDSNGDSFLIT